MATATPPQILRVLDPDTGEYVEPHEIVDGVPVDRQGRRYSRIVVELTIDDDNGSAGREGHLDPIAKAYEEAYEIVDGQPTEWPVMGTYPEELVGILQEYLGPFVRKAKLGRCIPEARFRVIGEKNRRPDLAFISASRWPLGRRAPNAVAWPVLPDLAVEVVSRTDEAWDVLAKVREYFDAGVRMVWLVYPNLELIHVYHAFDRIEVVARSQTLDGGAVVPGFRLPLVDLFLEEEEISPAPNL